LSEAFFNFLIDLNANSTNGHEELIKALGSGLNQKSKKISKCSVSLPSYEDAKPKIGRNYLKTTFKEYHERQSSKHRNKRNPWKPIEDAKLLELVRTYGECWAMISSKMGDRTGKQIRDRYLNILRPNLKKGEWTPPEDALLVNLYYQIGHKWSLIAKYMPGRSEAQVKNRFYSHIKKRLQERPSEFNIPSFTQDFANKEFDYNEIEEENESENEESSVADHLSEHIKTEDNDKKNVKVEFSETESESENIKQEIEEEINHSQKTPAKIWDHYHLYKKSEQEEKYHEEFVREYKEAMGSYISNSERVRTNPINEKEVDMVLEILARYYEQTSQTIHQEQVQRELINKNLKRDEDKSKRLRQLDTRKAQLEFLLNQTLKEMDNIQQKKK